MKFCQFALVPPKIVPFDFGEEPTNFEDSVSVNCLISTGDMPVDINWLHNNKTMQPFGTGVTILKNGKRVSVLTIDAVHAGHVGVYTCVAKNRAGQANHSAELHVNGGNSFENFKIIFFNFIIFCCHYLKSPL